MLSGPLFHVSVESGPVDLARLDELMRMIGEMVTSRARLEEQIKHAKRSLPSSEWRSFEETTQVMSRQLRDLREGVMRVRMSRSARSSNGCSSSCETWRGNGKRIILNVSGRETEIDKFLVERMMDPLLHLVRNAVSHGLERPDERVPRESPLRAV
jgi:two-component system chemotaxis sensor kinase CheA